MKPCIIWSTIPLAAAVTTAAPAPIISKHTAQVDISLNLARDTSRIPPETKEDCVARCKGDGGKPDISPLTIPQSRHDRLVACSGMLDSEKKEKTGNPDETEKTENKPSKPENVDEKPEKTDDEESEKTNRKSKKVKEPERTEVTDKIEPPNDEDGEKPKKPEKTKDTNLETPDRTNDETEKTKDKTDNETDEKPNKEREPDHLNLTFENETEWTEWLKNHQYYEEISPPV